MKIYLKGSTLKLLEKNKTPGANWLGEEVDDEKKVYMITISQDTFQALTKNTLINESFDDCIIRMLKAKHDAN